MYCVKCGKILESNDRFCSGCGTVNPDFYVNSSNNINGPDITGGTTSGQNSGFTTNNNGRTYSSGSNIQYGQTISPYAGDMPSSGSSAAQNIPPVYSSEGNTAVGFTDNSAAFSGSKPANNNGKKKMPVSAAIALALSGIIGVTCLAGFIGYSRTRSHTYVNRSNSVSHNIERPEKYDFNPLNNIKRPETIWETDEIKISTCNIMHPYDSSRYAELQLKLENKTNQKLQVRTKKVLINGCDTDSYFSSILEAGNTETDEISIYINKLNELNIENINNIDLWFEVEDENYDTAAASDRITIETNNETADNIYSGPEKMLYDENGIKIGYYGKEYVNDYNNDVYLKFYYENAGDLNVDFKIDSMSINGEMIKIYEHDLLYSKSKGVFDIRVDEDKLKEIKVKDIDDIDDILFTVKGYEESSYGETVFSADDLYTKTPD